jgi:hypothetical protein
MSIPGFSALRVPARFWMMSVLCLSVVGALVFQRLVSRFPSARTVLAAVVIVGVVADAWIAAFPVSPVPESWKPQTCAPSSESPGALMELPLGEVVADIGAMYKSMAHGRPTVNGYSGYFPPHYTMLRYALGLRDPDLLTQLATLGVEFIVIDRERGSARALRRFIAEQKQALLVCTNDSVAVYRLNRLPVAPSPRTMRLPIAGLYANVNGNVVGSVKDGDLTTRWETGPQEPGMMLEIDLGSPRMVSAVDLSLGPFNMDFPRGLRIETSEDRTAWQEVWRGSSAGLAVIGALRDRTTHTLTYDFPPVRAQYLRLWLTGKDNVYYWSVAELNVFGP